MQHSDFEVEAADIAVQVADRLLKNGTDRVVLAESCTAGLVSALLGRQPGISKWLCGSAVTYRESVKQSWLDVSAETLADQSPESLETTREMAIGVLRKTSEATLSAAVTGHLGPDAPDNIDGRINVAVARRKGDSIEIADSLVFQLMSSTRVDRQHEAATNVLNTLLLQLND